MLMEDYLDLKEIFSPEVLWELLPPRIPGRVSYKFTGGNTGKIEPLIEIYYPDGKLMRDLYSTELAELSIGDKVIFRLKDSREDKRREKQQPNLKDACDVEFALDEHIQNLDFEFDPVKVASLGRRLKEVIEDLDEQKITMQKDIERQVNELTKLRNQKLDEREKVLTDEQVKLESEKAKLDEREEVLDQLVAEQVAEKKLELETYEAKLRTKEEKIEKDNKALKKLQQELNGQRTQLASSIAKFQEEGGEKFIEYIKAFEQSDELLKKLAPLPNSPLPKYFLNLVNSKLAKDNYRINPAVSAQFLLSALTAANTGQFVVLSGPTGVGKTSMVNTFAAALGAGSGVVPVRPSWIDPTDLLGFYNPQLQRYQASPFMDCLLDAKRHSEANRLYFLTLDEMNLGRVENYAADFLSRLEKAHTGEGNASIFLYSRDIEQQLRRETSKFKDATETDLDSLAHVVTHISKYPSNFKIPEGLVLFGTINLDETTYHLSPKFLDRSFVINISAQELLPQITNLSNFIAQAKSYFDLSMNTAQELGGKQEKLPPEIQAIWDDVLHWQKYYIQPLGIHLGFRFSQTYLIFMKTALQLDLAPRAAASAYFRSKLFPWISFHQDDPAVGNPDQTKLEVLENWVKDNSFSAYPEEYDLRASLQNALERGSASVVVRFLE